MRTEPIRSQVARGRHGRVQAGSASAPNPISVGQRPENPARDDLPHRAVRDRCPLDTFEACDMRRRPAGFAGFERAVQSRAAAPDVGRFSAVHACSEPS